MRNSSGIPAGNWTATRILRNGGGFTLQINFSSDGTAIIGCDVHGCYILSPTDEEWRPLVTAATIPSADVPGRLYSASGGTGSYAVAISYSDSSRAYFTYNGYLYSYNDTTKAATRTALAQKILTANGPDARLYGRKLAVDRADPDTFIFGTPGQSVFVSTDGGTTVTDLSVSPGDNDPQTARGYYHLVAIDPTSSKQRFYYAVRATGSNGGIYESTTGPTGTYTLISGSPKDAVFMDFDHTGRLWVCSSASGGVYSYTHAAGTFTQNSTMPAKRYASVAVDPADSTHIVATNGTDTVQSLDNGMSWQTWAGDKSTSPAKQLCRATTQAYLDTGPLHNWNESVGIIQFNPAKTNELWQAWGFGPKRANLPTSNSTPITWFEMAKGIDEANCRALLIPPGGELHAGFLDLGTWRITDFENATNRPKTPQNVSDDWTLYPPVIVQPTDSLDYAKDNPLWIATQTSKGWNPSAGGSQHTPHHGYSEDGGKTWKMFPTQPLDDPLTTPFGGTMAVGNAGNVIYIWNEKQRPVYTKDFGVTWAELTGFPGLAANGSENGLGDWGDQFCPKQICADSNGHWYMHNYGPTGNTGIAGIWKSTDKGDSWTQIYAGVFNNSFYNRRLRIVPGHDSDLFFASGYSDGEWDSTMSRSTDGGVTWSVVANTGTIYDVAFSPFGGSYPAIMVAGEVNSEWGFHISYDNCVSWTHLGWLGDWIDIPHLLVGSQDKFEFYAGTVNSGILRIAYDFTLELAA